MPERWSCSRFCGDDPLRPGLQPERTKLAWRRTALAVFVGSLVAIRLLPAVFNDPWWSLAGVTGVVCSAALWIAARARYRDVTARLARSGDRAILPGARLLAATASFVFVGGLAGAAVVMIAAGS